MKFLGTQAADFGYETNEFVANQFGIHYMIEEQTDCALATVTIPGS